MHDKRKIEQFAKDFQDSYLLKLNMAHINILLSSEKQFVGTKTLSLSIKFLALSMKYKQTRQMVKPYIETILFNISLPLFLTSPKDLLSFETDPIEYVRLQVYTRNEYNVKS